MTEPAPALTATAVETATRGLWAARQVPPPDGFLGSADGPLLRQFLGTFSPSDPPALVAHRAVVADVDARYLALTGRRVLGTLRHEVGPADRVDSPVGALLVALGVWTGGTRGQPWDDRDWHAAIQGVTARLAQRGALVARDGPLRFCTHCAIPCSPERIIYQQELGDTYLVRFPLRGFDAPVDALVWVDAPWRLLGTSALLVHPDVGYVIADYARKDATARLLTARSSLERLTTWLHGSSLTVVKELPGRELVGREYAYPLRHEFPIGGELTAPAGTIQAVTDVGDSGTGIVPLVPGHGGTDARIAERLGIAGWPLLTPHGRLDPTLMHAYSGLDVDTTNEFVARDLSESGAVLARLRVLRGVPFCAVCGHPLVWMPGRAWCLEIRNLPAEAIGRYGRLLPGARPIGQIEITPWPVSETAASVAPSSIALLECGRCERLDAPDGPARCPCGGNRRLVSRQLLASIAGAFAAWARNEPLAPADSVRIYANDRRRAPTLVHHLAAMAGVRGASVDVGLTVVPTVGGVDLPALLQAHGSDAVRAAFVRTEFGESAGGAFAERCRQEAARLARLRSLAADVVARSGAERVADLAAPARGSDRELEAEDRAILARWARTELLAIAEYGRWDPASAQRRIYRFVDGELAEYRSFVRTRIEGATMTPGRRTALRTEASILRSIAAVLAPIAPFTAEWIRRTLLADASSVFERFDLGSDSGGRDERVAEAWDRWHDVVVAADRFRRDRHLPPGTVVPSAILVLADDSDAEKLRSDRTVIERLARVGHLVVGSPSAPWPGRRRRLVAVESEIRRVYPSLVQPIVHLINRLPPRRAGEEAKTEELSVVVQGQPRRIFPSMVSVVDLLPDRTVPVPFAHGEMYVEAPASGTEGRPPPPPLSPDAFWLLRRVDRALRRAPPSPGAAPRVALTVASDPLATELRDNAPAIAKYLDLAEFRIVDRVEEARPPHPISGRTRTGTTWWVSIPGLVAPRRRAKHRTASAPARRVPRPTDPASELGGVDYSDAAVIAQSEAIRTLGEQLDGLLAAPLLGPSKVAIAWDAGLRSVEQFSEAPFDRIVAIPGFGRPVAATLWTKLGREVPRPPPVARVPRRTRPAKAPPLDGAGGVGPLPGARPEGAPIAGPIAGNDRVVTPVAPPSEPPSSDPTPREPPPEPPAPSREPAAARTPGATTEGTVGGEPLPAEAETISERPPSSVAPEIAVAAAAPSPSEPFPPVGPEPARTAAPPEPAPPPPPTGLELDLSESLLPALRPFLEETAAGHHGVAIVREMPDRIRAHVGPRPVSVYWLTNLVREGTLKPNDLSALTDRLNRALASESVTAVFLEGVEYLVRIHGIDRIVAFLHDLDATLTAHEARGWLHLTPSLLPTSDVDRIVAALGRTPGPPAGPETPEPPP